MGKAKSPFMVLKNDPKPTGHKKAIKYPFDWRCSR
jgi:hypothetical protein